MNSIPLLPVPDGYFVRINHYTQPNELIGLCQSTTAKPPRYATMASVYGPGDQFVCEAWAFCSPKDSPSRKRGRAIAHNRAVTKLKRELLVGPDPIKVA